MEQILGYIERYGLSVFVIACCIIAVIGILKLCKVFDKITNKSVKKLIYYALNVVLAFGGSAIYFAIFKINFSGYLVFSAAQVGTTTTLYALYENFGLRKLVQIGLDCLAKKLKNDPDAKLSKTLKGFGLSEEAIANVRTTVITEAEKAKALSETSVEPVAPATNPEVKQ